MLNLLLALAAQTQDALADERLAALVSSRVNAAPINRVVEELAKSCPVPLTASPALSSQIVIVSVKDRPWRELLSRVAKVTDSQWTLTGGVLKLEAAKPMRDQALSEHVETVATEVSKVFGEYQAIAESPYKAPDIADEIIAKARRVSNDQDFEDSAGPEGQWDSINPSGRILAKALVQLDPREVARMDYDERVVYSTKPNKMQRPLQLKPLVQSLASDQESYEEALLIVRKIWPDIEKDRTLVTEPFSTVERVTLAIARCEASFGLEAITATCTVWSGDGRSAASNAVLWMDTTMARLLNGVQPKPVEPKFDARPDSVWHAKALADIGQGEPVEKRDKRYQTLVSHPEVFDPLSFLVSDVLVGFSDHVKLDLVAELSDYSLVMSFLREGEDPWKTLQNSLLPSLFEQLPDQEGWLLLTPRARHATRQSQVSRPALGAYIRDESRDTLDGVCKYAVSRGTDRQVNVVELATVFCSVDESSFLGMPAFFEVESNCASFLGSLEQSQKRQLYSGSALTFASLSPEQKSLFERVVLGSRSPEIQNYQSQLDGPERSSPSDRPDPTDLVPNGVPGDAAVRVTTKDEPILYQWEESKAGWEYLDLQTLAYIVAAKVNPKVWEGGSNMPLPTRLRTGRQRQYAVKFWVSKRDYFGFDFSEQAIDPSKQEFRVEQLPLRVRRALDESVKKILDDADGSGGRGDK